MNKRHLVSGSLVLLLTGAVSIVGSNSQASFLEEDKDIVAAYAANESFRLVLNESSNVDFSYQSNVKKYAIKNFNNDDVYFSVKRGESTSGHLIRLSGAGDGGFISNEHDDSIAHANKLNGITSIKVNYTSTSGKLVLKTAKDSYNFSPAEDIFSGVEITFTDADSPDHFRIENVSGAGASNDVFIESIVIEYHGYDFNDNTAHIFNQILGEQAPVSIGAKNSHILYPNYNLLDNNYLKFVYSSNTNIKGEITYRNSANSSQHSTESFFLEKACNSTVFCMYLDAFRNSAKGKYQKIIENIKFTNVGYENTTFSLHYLGCNNSLYTRETIYKIKDDVIEVGISLKLGGAINSIRNISKKDGYNIQEYVTNNGEIKIRSSEQNTDVVGKVIANNPNLVNCFDLGREVQQSYYFGVDSSNGYTRGRYLEQSRDYNPVQCGDNSHNESQIVDFKVLQDVHGNDRGLWVRTKACDWALNNSVTDSYMENTYSIRKGLLYVTNRFVDFSGFDNYPFDDAYQAHYISNYEAISNGYNNKQTTFGYVGKQTIELPAVYVSHPLNYYSTVAEESKVLIFDNEQGWNANTNEQSHAYVSGANANMVPSGTYNGETTYKSSANRRSYHYATRINPEKWLGYFNEDKFGLALYVPVSNYNHEGNRHVFTSGNYGDNHTTSDKTNTTYLDGNYKEKTSGTGFGYSGFNLESYLANNTNYLSTILGFYPHEYTPLEWTYAIGADYLDVLRSKFNSITDINNDFSVWSGCEF